MKIYTRKLKNGKIGFFVGGRETVQGTIGGRRIAIAEPSSCLINVGGVWEPAIHLDFQAPYVFHNSIEAATECLQRLVDNGAI